MPVQSFVAKEIKLSLILGGRENIPIKGITVSSVADQPLTATIELVPTTGIFKLLPHTQVCVVYKEHIQIPIGNKYRRKSAEAVEAEKKAEAEAAEAAKAADFIGPIPKKSGTKKSTTLGKPEGAFYGSNTDKTNFGYKADWKVLFLGEAMSIGMTKRRGVHQVIINCMDFSNYWNDIRHEQISLAGEAALLSNKSYMTEGAEESFDAVGMDYATNISNFFSTASKYNNFNTAFTAFIQHYASFGDSNGKEGFFARAETKNKFAAQLFASGSDNSVNKIMSMNMLAELIRGYYQGTSGMISLRNMIDYILQVTMYSSCHIAAPPFRFLSNTNYNIESIAFMPKLLFAYPPSFNIIFPGMYESISYNKQFNIEPTRLVMRTNTTILEVGKGLHSEAAAPSNFWLARLEQLRRIKKDPSKSLYIPALGDETFSGPRLEVYPSAQGKTLTSTAQLDMMSVVASEGKNAEEINDYLRKTANFVFYDSKYFNRQVVIDGVFNPSLVANLPGGVIIEINKKYFAMLGFIQSVTHQVNAEGFATTQAVMSHVRFEDELDKTGQASNIFDSSKAERWREYIEKAATETDVPVMLIVAIMKRESGFDPNVSSKTDAYGLMQVLDSTVKGNIDKGGKTPGLEKNWGKKFNYRGNNFDNIRAGAYMLKELMANLGDMQHAIGGYLVGEGVFRGVNRAYILSSTKYLSLVDFLKAHPTRMAGPHYTYRFLAGYIDEVYFNYLKYSGGAGAAPFWDRLYVKGNITEFYHDLFGSEVYPVRAIASVASLISEYREKPWDTVKKYNERNITTYGQANKYFGWQGKNNFWKTDKDKNDKFDGKEIIKTYRTELMNWAGYATLKAYVKGTGQK